MVGRSSDLSMTFRHLALLGLLVLTTGCSTLGIQVDSRTERVQGRETRALLRTAPAADPAVAALAASQEARLSDREKLTRLVTAARLALKGNKPAVYNAAVGQIVTLVADEHFENLPAGLTVARSGPALLDPTTPDQLSLASSIRIKGLLTRTVQPGLGVPYVAWFAPKNPALARQAGIPPLGGMAIPVTAYLTFRGDAAELRFQETLQSDHASIGGSRKQLAADFSASIAVLLSHGRNSSIDLRSLFLSANLDEAGLFQFQPYDPRKIPVVFVHGLISRPEAWTQALNALLADPKIREKYQFWFFLYPTGLPVWRTASILRDELDRYHQHFDPQSRNPRLQEMVLVGHSMGGLVSSLMVREGGERLWRQFSDVSPRSVHLSAEAKQQILELVYFQPRHDVSRVIFVATPHQGSYMAVNPVVGFLSTLIRLPFNLISQSDRQTFLAAIRDDSRGLFVAPANSLTFLRARSPLLLSILKLPMDKKIPYHSIIGDRGRGDTPDSSDGVVPYWSSHLDGAVSEKIVPSGHGANENAEGIAEIRRILAQ